MNTKSKAWKRNYSDGIDHCIVIRTIKANFKISKILHDPSLKKMDIAPPERFELSAI